MYGLYVNIHIKRHSGYYLVTVILPIMVRLLYPPHNSCTAFALCECENIEMGTLEADAW